jgi:hypothetical protein
MGPCQGRICGPVAIEVLAAARGVGADSIEPMRTRFPTKPISLEALATFHPDTLTNVSRFHGVSGMR